MTTSTMTAAVTAAVAIVVLAMVPAAPVIAPVLRLVLILRKVLLITLVIVVGQTRHRRVIVVIRIGGHVALVVHSTLLSVGTATRPRTCIER